MIFTCFASRAIHLEVAHCLDTDSCINAIRRFVSRRGSVKRLWSDNGTNLVGACKELKAQVSTWDQNTIRQRLQQQNIEWRFNPPTGSHFGGVWECLIRSVRKVLYMQLQERPQKLDDEALQTLFCEVEVILNARPITTVSNDPEEPEALTPNHLLLLRYNTSPPSGQFESQDNFGRRRWRQVQYLADSFWKRWVKEYLPCLQERQKWTTTKRNVSVGDIVLLVEENIRSSYSLGRVIDTLPDREGVVRIVTIETSTTTLQRPVSKLCVLVESELL